MLAHEMVYAESTAGICFETHMPAEACSCVARRRICSISFCTSISPAEELVVSRKITAAAEHANGTL